MPGLPTFSLDGKRALVTGAGRGLGAAIAKGLAEGGARVALVSRTQAELQAVVSDIGAGAAVLVADVSELASLEGLVDAAEGALQGKIDIVVHAAGVQHREPAEDIEPSDWVRVINVNLTAPFFLSQEIARRQLQGGLAGSHIFIASLTSQLSIPNVAAYTASKSGIYGVLRNLSLEWSGRGIRANGIGPGYVQTALTEELMLDPVRRQKLLDRIPMGRLGKAADMVGAAVFLASEASSYVSGQLLMVDGGWSAS